MNTITIKLNEHSKITTILGKTQSEKTASEALLEYQHAANENVKVAINTDSFNTKLILNQFRIWTTPLEFKYNQSAQTEETGKNKHAVIDSGNIKDDPAEEWFKTQLNMATDRDTIAKIKAAQKRHTELREAAQIQFFRALMNELADQLKQTLKELKTNLESHSINQEKTIESAIRKIKSWNSEKIETKEDCDVLHNKINQINNDIIKDLKPANNNKGELIQKSQQLSTVTKRWIDYHYIKPRRLSRWDKARQGANAISLFSAGVLATTAFAMMFTPAAPLAPIIGLTSMVGLLPELQDIYDMARSLWHKRAPLKADVKKLGLTAVMLSSLIVPTQFFLNASKNLISVGKILGNYVFNGIGSVLNSVSSVVLGQEFHTRQNAHLTMKEIKTSIATEIPFSEYEQVKQEKYGIGKMQKRYQAIKDKQKKQSTHYFYINKKEVIPSQRENIIATARAAAKYGQEKEAIREYETLPARSSKEKVLEALRSLSPLFNTDGRAEKLKEFVEKEQNAITKSEQSKKNVKLIKFNR